MGHRIFHFSEDGTITRFDPRPVAIPTTRRPGEEWLNGPLVWAVVEERQATYLFPRECPRIVMWRREVSSHSDVARWLGDTDAACVTFIEREWLDPVSTGSLYRYELPTTDFEPTSDGWMWVSRSAAVPLKRSLISDLPGALVVAGAELRVVERPTDYREAWTSKLHVSGIRLRNARGWTESAQ